MKDKKGVLWLISFLFIMSFVSCNAQKNNQTSSKVDTTEIKSKDSLQVAIFGGGCFWCTEAVFLMINGVASVEPGYAGGETDNPTYEQICTGRTGHAEVIKIQFDSSKVSYFELLKVFFATHDPTTLNRQGADVGTQYRSVIFTQDSLQKTQAEQVIGELTANEVYLSKIVTQIEGSVKFYPAENYHINYYNRNPNQGYCRAVIQPKIEKFEKSFTNLIRK